MNTTFLGIGTGEIIAIFIIGVLVVGPEKMVKFASDVGHFIAKIRKLTSGVTDEVKDALAVDEIRGALNDATSEVRGAVRDVKETGREVRSVTNTATAEVRSAVGEVRTAAGTATREAAAQVQEAKVAPTRVIANLPPARPLPTGTRAQAAKADDDRAASVEAIVVRTGELVGNDEDAEPTVLDDVALMVDTPPAPAQPQAPASEDAPDTTEVPAQPETPAAGETPEDDTTAERRAE